MFSYTDLKAGKVIIINGQPHEIMAAGFLRMQQRKAVVQVKLKNLLTGKIIDRNIHQNEEFEEADVERRPIKYLYNHRGEYWFSELNNSGQRFSLKEDVLGNAAKFLKLNGEATALVVAGRIINIKLPIKIDLEVRETSPGDRGDTASGGRKPATLETGAVVQVPLFIKEGDLVRVNTETGEYSERVEKV